MKTARARDKVQKERKDRNRKKQAKRTGLTLKKRGELRCKESCLLQLLDGKLPPYLIHTRPLQSHDACVSNLQIGECVMRTGAAL